MGSSMTPKFWMELKKHKSHKMLWCPNTARTWHGYGRDTNHTHEKWSIEYDAIHCLFEVFGYHSPKDGEITRMWKVNTIQIYLALEIDQPNYLMLPSPNCFIQSAQWTLDLAVSSETSDKIGMIQRRLAWPLRKDLRHCLLFVNVTKSIVFYR